jgi:hypothetical protein
MSVAENAGQLISHANDYLQNGIAGSSMAGDSFNRAIQILIQIRQNTEESVSTVSQLLGAGHAAVGSISGVAESVKSKVFEVQNVVEGAIDMLIDLDQTVTTYANTVGSVGRVLSQGL